MAESVDVVIEHQVTGGAWEEVWRGRREEWLTGEVEHLLPQGDRKAVRALRPGESHELTLHEAAWRVTAIAAGFDTLATVPVDFTLYYTGPSGAAHCGIRLARPPEEGELVVVGLHEPSPGALTDEATELVVGQVCLFYHLHPHTTRFLRWWTQGERAEELIFTWRVENGGWVPVPGKLKAHREGWARMRWLLQMVER